MQPKRPMLLPKGNKQLALFSLRMANILIFSVMKTTLIGHQYRRLSWGMKEGSTFDKRPPVNWPLCLKGCALI